MEGMMYCHHYNIKFILFADDANFTSGEKNGGWNDLFESFCEESHMKMNRFANTRSFRGKKIKVFIQYRLNEILKFIEGAKYTTQDLFSIFIGKEFKETFIDWDLMAIHGTVKEEYAKLRHLAMRYNKEVWKEMEELVKKLQMPEDYVSVHIRGGDKIQEVDELITVEECLQKMDTIGIGETKNVFVFTDDFRNVEKMEKLRPEWNIFSLTDESEKGYYNGDFNSREWEYRRKNLIKLFTIVEICIASKIHFGYKYSCANNVIYSCKAENAYVDLV